MGIFDDNGDFDPDHKRPLADSDLDRFMSTDPDHIARLNEVYAQYSGSSEVDARRATSRWLERFNIPKSDPRYEIEFNRLIEQGASNRAVLAETRRIGERAELVTLTDGDNSLNCVYVAEGDNPCPECAALSGEEGSLSMFEDGGMMPGDRCLGGDNCKCVLIPIERR